MAKTVAATVDTSMIDEEPLAHLRRVADEHSVTIEVCTVTVNRRERGQEASLPVIAESLVWGESRWDEAVWGDDRPIRELLILDETPLGDGVLAGIADETLFEAILKVISSGAFPPPGRRDSLTEGQLHQLREAMSLEAHTRAGRDVLITNDRTGFVNHGRRTALEQLCSTQIVTPDEIGRVWP